MQDNNSQGVGTQNSDDYQDSQLYEKDHCAITVQLKYLKFLQKITPRFHVKVQSAISNQNLLGKGSPKAQSAMEYLMTYGWSILLVAVVIAGLFELGVFNGGSAPSSACISQSGFLCINPVLATNGTVNAIIGTEYTGVTVTGTACTNSTVQPPVQFTAINPGIVLASGEEMPADFQCKISSNATGTKFAGVLWLQYTRNGVTGITGELATVILKSTKQGSALAASISPNPAGVDSGQGVTLMATASGGPSPYTYQWYTASAAGTCSSSDTAISSATSSTYTASPSSDTFYCVIVNDASSQRASSQTDLVSVNTQLQAGTITPPSPGVVTGNSITLTANPLDGTQPYSYQWYTAASSGTCSSSDTAISGTTSSTYTTPALTSNTYYCATISDTYGETANTLTDYVTVYPVLSNPNYAVYTSSSTASATVDPGNQIYVCAIGTDGEPLSSESWTQTTNTIYTSIGVQTGSTCSASLSSAGGSIISAYGVDVPTTTDTVYSNSTMSEPNTYQLQYTVTNSINTVVIAFSKESTHTGMTLPSGCSQVLYQADSSSALVYYAVCVNQAPGTYIVNPYNWINVPVSLAVFVYENS